MSTDPYASTSADLIRGLKAHLGVTSDEELASALGVGKSTIASWRRRGAIPAKVEQQIVSRYGVTKDALDKEHLREGAARSFVLRYAFFFVVVRLSRVDPEGDDSELANDWATIEPYLERTIAKAASDYVGVVGAVDFLSDLRSGKIEVEKLVREASEDRRRTLEARGASA